MISVKITVNHSHGEIEIEETVLSVAATEEAVLRQIDGAAKRAAARARCAVAARDDA